MRLQRRPVNQYLDSIGAVAETKESKAQSKPQQGKWKSDKVMATESTAGEPTGKRNCPDARPNDVKCLAYVIPAMLCDVIIYACA